MMRVRSVGVQNKEYLFKCELFGTFNDSVKLYVDIEKKNTKVSDFTEGGYKIERIQNNSNNIKFSYIITR